VEEVGYILPFHFYTYTDYHLRILKDKFDYAKYFPAHKLYNENKPYQEKYDYIPAERKMTKKVKKMIGKGLHIDVYV
jgi:hypothetical protein